MLYLLVYCLRYRYVASFICPRKGRFPRSESYVLENFLIMLYAMFGHTNSAELSFQKRYRNLTTPVYKATNTLLDVAYT